MLKKSAIRRITTASIALIIASILYFFPSNETMITPNKTHYIDVLKTPIYLLNKEELVVRTDIAIENNDTLNKIKELITALTINSEKKEYILKNFKQIIPEQTKVLDISLTDGLLKVNFSKEFLTIEKDKEEALIEALIYTLTDIEEVKEIMIFIDGEKLNILPQSKIILPNTLDRNYGINKIYDLNDLKNSSKTTVYFLGKEDDVTYYIPVTKINNTEKNKIEVIIEELKSSPIYETNLISYLASSAELLNYQILENQVNLSFNNYIFDDLNEKNILEEVKYSISLSLKDSIGAKQVNFIVDEEVIDTIDVP